MAARRVSDETAAAMWEQYQQGATLEEVGHAFARTHQAVSLLFRARGWPTRPRVPRTADERRLAAAAAHVERRERLDAIKLGLGCQDCGYREHPAALQFDHRDPAGKSIAGSFASNLTRSWDWVLAEVAKCDVVCANCHAVRTATWMATAVTGQPHAARVTRTG